MSPGPDGPQPGTPAGPGHPAGVRVGPEAAAHAAAARPGGATRPVPGADPAPGSVTDPPSDPRVADAVSRLAELDQLPLAEQVEVYADVHRRLAAVLADPDSRAQ